MKMQRGILYICLPVVIDFDYESSSEAFFFSKSFLFIRLSPLIDVQANDFGCFNHKNRFEKKESYNIQVWYIIINQCVALYLHCILKVGCGNALKKVSISFRRKHCG